MPVYRYAALDRAGKSRKGILSAETLHEARGALQRRALFPTDITETHNRGRKNITAKARAQIARQMAVMIGAGVSVDDTLRALIAQSTHDRQREVLSRVRVRVREGKRLSEALRADEGQFDALFIAMVAAGEASGKLGAVLARAADHSESTEALRSKLRAALIYPAVLSLVAIGVLTMLIIVIVPRVAMQFAHFDQSLPWATRAVLDASEFLTVLGLPLLILFLLGGVLFRRALQNEAFRLRCDTRALRLWGMGRFLQMVGSAHFAHTLGALLASGCPATEALRAARQTQSNHFMRRAVDTLYERVMEGGSLSSAIGDSNAFAPLLVQMAGLGERSGTLPELLLKAADSLEQEIDSKTRTLLSLLEPIIIVVMGVVVGFVVMAIMLPILRLNTMIMG